MLGLALNHETIRKRLNQVDEFRLAVRPRVKCGVKLVEGGSQSSKMNNAIVREALWRVTQWGITARLRKHPHG